MCQCSCLSLCAVSLLFIACCLLRAIVVRCLLFVVCGVVLVALLAVSGCVLFRVSCFIFLVSCFLFALCLSFLFRFGWSLVIVRCSFIVAGCSLFVFHVSLALLLLIIGCLLLFVVRCRCYFVVGCCLVSGI